MLTLFIFLAMVTERLNELTFGRFFGEGKKYPDLGWALLFSSLFYGILIAVVFKVAIITWAAQELMGVEIATLSAYVDNVLSGILLSGGATMLHQLLSAFAPEKTVKIDYLSPPN